MRSRSATTFGRDGELRQLLALADKARAGEAVSVLVHGEAGVGKTRVMSDLVATLREQDAVVFVGHGVHLTEGEVPFGVLTESLRDLVRTVHVDRVRDALGPDAEQLAPLVPALRSGTRGEAVRARVISTAADLVETLAEERLVCWVVEDLQWSDTATRDAFTYLARFLTSVRLLLVATWRDEEGGAARPSDMVDTVALDVLRGVDLVALVAEVAPTLEGRDRERVVELSQGLPFLVEELVDSWRPGVGIDPAYLRRLVLTRLPDLSPPARELVELAAAGQGHLDVRLLEDQLGVDPAAIREAVDAGLLESGPGDGTLRFRHALLREAVLDAVPPGDRRRLHRRWAEAIEGDDRVLTGSARVFALATHWHDAQDPEKALPALAAAARSARRQQELSVEHAALSKVLECWDQVPDAEGLTGLTRERAMVDTVREGMALGAFDETEKLLRAECARVRPEDDPVGAAWAALRFAVFEDNFRKTEAGRLEVESLLGAELDDPRLADGVDLLVSIGLPADLATRAFAQAERLGEKAADPDERLRASMCLARIRVEAGDFEHALAMTRDQRSRLSGAVLSEEWAVATAEVWLLLLLGRAAEAAGLAERELARISRPSTLSSHYASLAENLAGAYIATGRWDEALEVATTALGVVPELLEDEPVVLVNDILRAHIISVQLSRGQLTAARRTSRLVEGHIGTDPWSDRSPVAEILAQLAALSAAEGDLARCRAELAGAWELATSPALSEELPRAVMTALRAESSLVDRHDPAAVAESAALVGRIMATAEPLGHPGPRGAAWWAEAQAHAARSRGGDTAADWAPAVAGWRDCGQPYDVATCLRFLGEAALGDGDATAATEALSEAHELCLQLGAKPLGGGVLAVARRGRLAVGPVAPRTGPGPLTAREVEVLGLVAEGRSNRQIATELFMSPKTVSVHVSRILTKLGAANRTEAAATGRRLGLVD